MNSSLRRGGGPPPGLLALLHVQQGIPSHKKLIWRLLMRLHMEANAASSSMSWSAPWLISNVFAEKPCLQQALARRPDPENNSKMRTLDSRVVTSGSTCVPTVARRRARASRRSLSHSDLDLGASDAPLSASAPPPVDGGRHGPADAERPWPPASGQQAALA